MQETKLSDFFDPNDKFEDFHRGIWIHNIAEAAEACLTPLLLGVHPRGGQWYNQGARTKADRRAWGDEARGSPRLT